MFELRKHILTYTVCVGLEVKICLLIQRPENLNKTLKDQKCLRWNFVERVSNSLFQWRKFFTFKRWSLTTRRPTTNLTPEVRHLTYNKKNVQSTFKNRTWLTVEWSTVNIQNPDCPVLSDSISVRSKAFEYRTIQIQTNWSGFQMVTSLDCFIKKRAIKKFYSCQNGLS